MISCLHCHRPSYINKIKDGPDEGRYRLNDSNGEPHRCFEVLEHYKAVWTELTKFDKELDLGGTSVPA